MGHGLLRLMILTSVSRSDMWVSCAETYEWIEVRFVVETLGNSRNFLRSSDFPYRSDSTFIKLLRSTGTVVVFCEFRPEINHSMNLLTTKWATDTLAGELECAKKAQTTASTTWSLCSNINNVLHRYTQTTTTPQCAHTTSDSAENWGPCDNSHFTCWLLHSSIKKFLVVLCAIWACLTFLAFLLIVYIMFYSILIYPVLCFCYIRSAFSHFNQLYLLT